MQMWDWLDWPREKNWFQTDDGGNIRSMWKNFPSHSCFLFMLDHNLISMACPVDESNLGNGVHN